MPPSGSAAVPGDAASRPAGRAGVADPPAPVPTAPGRLAGPPPGPPVRRPSDRGSVAGWVAVGIGAVGASVVAARWAGHHLPACALREATGVACPACGLTRVAVAVGRADPLAALAADPAAVALLALVVVAALAQVLATVGRVEAGWLRSRALPVALVGLLAAHWATTLVTGGLPPS